MRKSFLIARFIFLPVALMASALALAAGVMTDQNGRQVNCPEKVERLVTLTIPTASMLIALDEGYERLAGMHPSSRPDIVDGLIGRIFPGAKAIRSDMTGEGFMPNVEALLAVRPDLVIQWGDRGGAFIDPIVRVGIPVLSLRYDTTELAAKWLDLMGRCIPGREGRGKALAVEFLAARDEIAETSAAIAGGKRPKVVYLYRIQGNAFQVAGKKTGMDTDIRLAGGLNVAAGLPGFALVGAEQLLAWAPEVILLNNFEKGVGPAMVFNNTLLAALPAVKEKRVYVYPLGGFRWDPPSHETPLTWRWLQTLFYPDARLPPLREKMRDGYLRLYGRAVTDEDIDHVLRMNDNGESLHYREKFGS
jgi:iron complex transport system substrate-binding protein